MFWTTRVNKIAGVTLLLLALGIILSVATSLPITDADPLERGEVEDLLVDIQDNQELFGLNHAIEIIIDSVVGIAAAGVLYLVFRSRNRTLALFGFAFLLAGQVAFVASDAGSLTLLFLADDFSLGGAGGLAPGDAAVVEVARAVAISSGLADQMGFTSLSVGLIAVGLLISWAPAGAGPVPPRWLGWLAAAAGLVQPFSWLMALDEGFFVIFIMGAIGTLVFLIGLGAWLLVFAPEERTSPAATG